MSWQKIELVLNGLADVLLVSARYLLFARRAHIYGIACTQCMCASNIAQTHAFTKCIAITEYIYKIKRH